MPAQPCIALPCLAWPGSKPPQTASIRLLHVNVSSSFPFDISPCVREAEEARAHCVPYSFSFLLPFPAPPFLHSGVHKQILHAAAAAVEIRVLKKLSGVTNFALGREKALDRDSGGSEGAREGGREAVIERRNDDEGRKEKKDCSQFLPLARCVVWHTQQQQRKKILSLPPSAFSRSISSISKV